MNHQNTSAESALPLQHKIDLPTSSRNVILLGLIFVALFFGVLGSWTATARLQGAVVAPGEIIVESYRKQVQHLDGGIVQEILVREGDWVNRNQVLIRLDGERVLATRDLYRTQMDALQARQFRLMAERDQQARIVWPEFLKERRHQSDLAENMQSEQEIFAARLAAKTSQKKLHQSQISQLESQIRGQTRQLETLQQTIASLQEEIAVKTSLLKGQYIDRSHVMELERSLNSYQVRKSELDTQISLARDKIQEFELRIADIETQYAREAATQLGEVRQSILELRERLRPVEDAGRRLEITAPESGVVVNMHVRTEGGVIRGGEPLMEIVPQNSSLIVSARIEPSRIDDVKLGQQASIALSAFPTRYTPKVDGLVTYVSADRVEPTHIYMQPYYRVYVRMDAQSLLNAIEDISRLTPGMPAEVYIQTEARTVLSYLMTPITESLNRAFRE